jgi:spore coat polysaccharide biosynthesis protein SpsF (cytidylyltransferase family)
MMAKGVCVEVMTAGNVLRQWRRRPYRETDKEARLMTMRKKYV